MNIAVPTPRRSITSALPLEVLGHITKLLAASHSKKNLKDIKSLALVCKAFLPSCTAVIFRHIHGVGFCEGIQARTHHTLGLRLQRLVQVFNAKPELLKYVRELKIRFGRTCPENYSQYKRCHKILLKLPNLTHLISLDGEPGKVELGWQKQLIQHYLAQNTLKSIYAEYMVTLDFDKVVGCPLVHDVHLNRVLVSPSATPSITILSNNITRLFVHGDVEFPLAILSEMRQLKALTFNDVSFVPSRLSERPPSMALESLCLDLMDTPDFSAFRDFYGYYERKVGSRPFGSLKRLRLHIHDEEDATLVVSLLQAAKNLVSLRVFSVCYSKVHPILMLDHHIQSVFRGLTSIVLCSVDGAMVRAPSHDEAMSYISALFISVSSINVLENVRISIGDMRYYVDTTSPQTQTLPTSHWGELAGILACPQRFPQLQRVSFSFKLGRSSFGPQVSITSWAPEETTQTPFTSLPPSMYSLGRRLGQNFRISFVFHAGV
ncbi:hypothetical protein CVT24_008116 [Panaeolus cyanescens]|uniref:F-box domain-containing protein n=1 Tax=Panaeolus cyanescens TaxID=181874 RepID=A0A409YLF4_9AGAR|nr:hypothetical protein CVT24_008116 [Panaeolus cyanescens]